MYVLCICESTSEGIHSPNRESSGRRGLSLVLSIDWHRFPGLLVAGCRSGLPDAVRHDSHDCMMPEKSSRYSGPGLQDSGCHSRLPGAVSQRTPHLGFPGFPVEVEARAMFGIFAEAFPEPLWSPYIRLQWWRSLMGFLRMIKI
jgi:hypothetical protein